VETIERALEQLRADRTSGASALSRRAAGALAEVARKDRASSPRELLHHLKEAAIAIAGARPSMVAVANTVGLLLAEAQEQGARADLASLRSYVAERASQIDELWQASLGAIAAKAAPLLPSVVMTHSHSSTVVGALTAETSRDRRLIVCEGRPLYEGRRLAQELADAGLAVTLITDAQAGAFMAEAKAVLVGADAVLADGSLVNKVGTYLLALAAHDHGIPFYVACEALKVSTERGWGAVVAPEEKEPEEVVPDGIPGVSVRNVYFDRTPARLVTSVITEDGVFRPEGIGGLVERARRYAAALAP
jgi:ribose 1,5-bisphosphate isomerase